jgi:hypothetical protein
VVTLLIPATYSVLIILSTIVNFFVGTFAASSVFSFLKYFIFNSYIDKININRFFYLKKHWNPEELYGYFKTKLNSYNILDVSYSELAPYLRNCKNIEQTNQAVKLYLQDFAAKEAANQAWYNNIDGVTAVKIVFGVVVGCVALYSIYAVGAFIFGAMSSQAEATRHLSDELDATRSSTLLFKESAELQISKLHDVVRGQATEIVNLRSNMTQFIRMMNDFKINTVQALDNLNLYSSGLQILVKGFGLEDILGRNVSSESLIAATNDFKAAGYLLRAWAKELAERSNIHGGIKNILPATYDPEAYAAATIKGVVATK